MNLGSCANCLIYGAVWWGPLPTNLRHPRSWRCRRRIKTPTPTWHPSGRGCKGLGLQLGCGPGTRVRDVLRWGILFIGKTLGQQSWFEQMKIKSVGHYQPGAMSPCVRGSCRIARCPAHCSWASSYTGPRPRPMFALFKEKQRSV
jgi:hypothetical protein